MTVRKWEIREWGDYKALVREGEVYPEGLKEGEPDQVHTFETESDFEDGYYEAQGYYNEYFGWDYDVPPVEWGLDMEKVRSDLQSGSYRYILKNKENQDD